MIEIDFFHARLVHSIGRVDLLFRNNSPRGVETRPWSIRVLLFLFPYKAKKVGDEIREEVGIKY